MRPLRCRAPDITLQPNYGMWPGSLVEVALVLKFACRVQRYDQQIRVVDSSKQQHLLSAQIVVLVCEHGLVCCPHCIRSLFWCAGKLLRGAYKLIQCSVKRLQMKSQQNVVVDMVKCSQTLLQSLPLTGALPSPVFFSSVQLFVHGVVSYQYLSLLECIYFSNLIKGHIGRSKIALK